MYVRPLPSKVLKDKGAAWMIILLNDLFSMYEIELYNYL